MSVQTLKLLEQLQTPALEIRVGNELRKEDYEEFMPMVEKLIAEHGLIRILFLMEPDFHGWTAGALWQDVVFDVKHFRHIERLAMVGDKKWEKGMALFCKPFTSAAIRWFDATDYEQARAWIEE
jgi:hypothetical protein